MKPPSGWVHQFETNPSHRLNLPKDRVLSAFGRSGELRRLIVVIRSLVRAWVEHEAWELPIAINPSVHGGGGAMDLFEY